MEKVEKWEEIEKRMGKKMKEMIKLDKGMYSIGM